MTRSFLIFLFLLSSTIGLTEPTQPKKLVRLACRSVDMEQFGTKALEGFFTLDQIPTEQVLNGERKILEGSTFISTEEFEEYSSRFSIHYYDAKMSEKDLNEANVTKMINADPNYKGNGFEGILMKLSDNLIFTQISENIKIQALAIESPSKKLEFSRIYLDWPGIDKGGYHCITLYFHNPLATNITSSNK